MIRISELLLNFVLNAGWQIAVILTVASIGSYFLRSAPARYRHILWLATLAVSLLGPLWSVTHFSPAVVPNFGVAEVKSPATNSALADKVAPTRTSEDEPTVLLTRRRQVVSTAPQSLIILSVVYGCFILFRVIRLARLWRGKEKLRRSAGRTGLPPVVESIAWRCRVALGLGSVPVACSTMALVPATLGARDPVIVLPESFCTEADKETLLSVIGHEMAHVSRHDFAINLICELISLPISFHPLTYLIKRQIHRTRELACDELVTEHVLGPHAYARSLVRVANATIRPVGEVLILSIFDGNILEERIMKLTQRRRQLGQRTGRVIMATAVSVLVAAVLSISTFSFDVRAHAIARRDKPVRIQPPVTQSTALAQEPGAVTQTRPRSQPPLNSPSSQERAQAACDAGRNQAVEMIPMLVSMLGDDSKIEPLRCWDSGRWNPALETFKQPSPGEQAAIALASMGQPAFQPLTDELLSANASVRRNAAWAIGELTNMAGQKRTAAVPQLVSLLGDSDEWVRMAAARALGELRDERAGDPLIGLLSDSHWRVRELAAWALSEMKEERAVKALCNALLTDAQADVRRTAAEALGEIRSQEAIASLKQALNDPEPRVRDKAGWAISEIEDSDG